VLSSAVLVLAASVAAAQADASGQNRLTPFDALIGTWCFEGTLLQDAPGAGAKGDKGTACLSWKWLYGKNAVEWEWTTDFAGKRAGVKGLIMWDAAGKQIVGHGVSSDGTNIRVTARFDLDHGATFEVAVISPNGKEGSSTELFTLADPNTLVYQIKKRNGLPDFGPYQLRRLK
jgi:hypothetical protein